MLDDLFDGIPWHQQWEIEPGVMTPGHNPVLVLMAAAAVPADLTGMSVLDIGPWNGCFSFECERRGAKRVLAIGPETPEATGFTKLKAYLGSQVDYLQGTVYMLDPAVIGTFDLVICFGVLYHLRHPMLALDMIRRVCLQRLCIETAGIDDNLVLARDANTEDLSDLRNHAVTRSRSFEGISLKEVSPILADLCLAQFYRGEELNRDSTNWFAFNKRCLSEMLHSSGFAPEHVECFGHRIAASCSVTPGFPEWMTNSGEGVYYDVITKPICGRREDFHR